MLGLPRQPWYALRLAMKKQGCNEVTHARDVEIRTLLIGLQRDLLARHDMKKKWTSDQLQEAHTNHNMMTWSAHSVSGPSAISVRPMTCRVYLLRTFGSFFPRESFREKNPETRHISRQTNG